MVKGDTKIDRILQRY